MNAKDKLPAKTAVKEKAKQDALEFFHDHEDYAYATVPVRSHRETWRIKSRKFWLWVARTLTEHQKVPPPKALVKDIVDEFGMWALCDGPERDVHVRLAGHDHVSDKSADWRRPILASAQKQARGIRTFDNNSVMLGDAKLIPRS